MDDSFIAKVNKRFGPGTLVRGSELKDRVWPRATTGSLAFDVMLGGGWPVNQWNEIVGLESQGKTVMALKTIAANQALDPGYECLWVASEDFVDPWAEQLGVDLKRLVLAPTNVMEEAYQIVIDALDERETDAVVIDSLPALIPTEEDEKNMEEFVVAVGAKLTAKFMRKSNKAQKRSLVDEDRDCLALVINQWRDKIGISYGDPRTTPGGKAKNYSFFTRVEVVRDGWLEYEKKKIGLSIKARTFKNKTAPPHRTGNVDFYFENHGSLHAGDYDRTKEVFGLATAYDLIERHGAYYTYGDERWKGKEEVLAALREEPVLYKLVDSDVRRVLR